MLTIILYVLLLAISAAGTITTATAILKATDEIATAVDDLARR